MNLYFTKERRNASHRLRWERWFCKNTQQRNNAVLPLKILHLIFSLSDAGLFWKVFTKYCLNQRSPSVIFFLTERLPNGDTYIFFFVGRLGKYAPFIEKKKISFEWRLRSQARCSHHLTMKYPCYSFPFFFWVHNSVILWETTKDIYIIQLSAKITDVLRRTELMFLAFKLQQKKAFVNFQWGFFCKSLFYS